MGNGMGGEEVERQGWGKGRREERGDEVMGWKKHGEGESSGRGGAGK